MNKLKMSIFKWFFDIDKERKYGGNRFKEPHTGHIQTKIVNNKKMVECYSISINIDTFMYLDIDKSNAFAACTYVRTVHIQRKRAN